MVFINLNDVGPKDYFPFPSIDQLTDATTIFNLMSFLEAYFGYHHIKMHPKDKTKTIFYY